MKGPLPRPKAVVPGKKEKKDKDPRPAETEDPVKTEVCWWIWNGDNWDSDPNRPHNCPLDQTCHPPSTTGTYIGEEISTPCEESAAPAEAPPQPE